MMSLSRIETLIRQLQGNLGGRIVRGTVTGAGAVAGGTGYSSVRTGVGAYTITFSQAFAAAPSVVVAVEGAGAITAKLGGSLAGSFTVATFTTTTGANLDMAFHFIAIG